ncbi:metallophosphoesterase [Polaromonas sp. AER18D-145]|uniref:metallophosphoesterase family protein n=1 Tax=Polaromonas sp. AER18D-145 TaxID=1977060 RepID=UPI000BBC1C42|nr:metallophosphoesterase [Polaromonas sp. AER18D-145]
MPTSADIMLFCGDPHGKFDHILQAAGDLRASAVILLGDMESGQPLHEAMASIDDKLWFIHGNHDTDSELNWNNLWGGKLADRNVDGRVVTLPNGIRIAGLGGVFRESVWYPSLPTPPNFRNRKEHVRATPWQGSVPCKHWSTIYPDELDRLSGMPADILITHEAPGYHNNGFELLDSLAQSMGVKVAVHGHHHDNLDSSDRWDRQGFKSFGVGLRGITAIDASGISKVIVPGELDAQRDFRQKYLDVFKDVAP